MPSSTVHCDNCGAPLQIESGTRFVTCNHCGSSLRVERTDSATFTQRLEEIKAKVDKAEGSVQAMRLQKELEKLDQGWARVQQQRSMNMSALPWPAVALVAGIGLFVTVFAVGYGFTVPFAYLGIAVTIGAIVAGVYSQRKASKPDPVEKTYRLERARLEQQLRAIGNHDVGERGEG